LSNSKLKSILIIANGKAPKKKFLQNLVKQSDCIIAADGGANICLKNNIYPDYVIGDFDSIDQKQKSQFKNAEYICRPDQEKHDLLKALKFCETFKPKKVVVTAVFGKRIDHTLSNFFILQNQDFKFSIEFVDDYSRVFIINKKHEFNLPSKQPVSFLSYAPVFGITLKGFKYNLNEKDFPNGFNGVSNEITEFSSSVTIKKGTLIAIVPHG